MVKLLVYENGNVRTDVPVDDIDHYIARTEPGTFLWLDISEALEEHVELLKEEFSFHPLSLEDAVHQHQRPKIEEYEGYFFLVTQAVRYKPDEFEVTFVELDLFVGRNFVVTVHRQPLPALDEALRRFQRNGDIPREGVGFAVYTIMDSIIDEYLPVLDTISDQVDDIEEGVFEHFDDAAIEAIFQLKRAMLNIRRMAGHLRDVFNVLMRRDHPLFSQQTIVYFRDIYDHLYRITDSVDIYRDVLSGALDAWLSLSSNRLNAIMKTFAGLSIMLMTAALVAGIYGMNFLHMPELKWEYGYYMAISLMAILMLAEFVIFRKQKWL